MVRHGGGHAAYHRKAPAGAGALVKVLVLLVRLQGGKVHFLGLEHALELLKGEHEVHVGTDGAPGGLQLLGGAGAHKSYLGFRVVLLDQAGGEHHGGKGHGDIVGKLREQLLCHDAPGRAAGGGHEGLLLRHLLQKVLRLLYGTQVRAYRHFHRVGKAQDAHGLAQLGRCGPLKLAHKGRSHYGDYLGTGLDGLDYLEYLALVGYGAEGAVHQAHAAGDALVVIYDGLAVFITAYGVHAAGLGAGPLYAADGVIGALVEALAALDALALVNVALAVLDVDGPLGAHRLAGMGQAALAVGGDPYLLGRAAVAGKGNDVY